MHVDQEIKYGSPQQVEYTKYPLGSKIPVGNHAHKKGRGQHSERKRGESRSLLHAGGPHRFLHVFGNLTIPGPPHKKLEEHHGR